MHYFIGEGTIGEITWLRDEDQVHARALRLKHSEPIALLNGMGKTAVGTVVIHSNKYGILVNAYRLQPPYEFHVNLAVALTKNMDRYEWLLEKGTELGVSTFIPLICQNNERQHVNLERAKKIIEAAVKQSGRPYMPEILEAVRWVSWVQIKKSGFCGLAHITGEDSTNLTIPVGQEITLAIGPEGDFTDAELEQARQAGWQKISLGPYRLRTETAAILLISRLLF
jgi:16S rRNA (uracil1498-N3)-methyltransferase